MKQFMAIIFIVPLLGYQFASTQETRSSWLIGHWDGNIEGFKNEGKQQGYSGSQHFS